MTKASPRKPADFADSSGSPLQGFTMAVWLFALLFPLLAISNQSFWIDEGITGNAARPGTLGGCWTALRIVNGSDLQMPFYMVYIWGWDKLFGDSEWVLRLANYPWFVIGQIAAAHIWRDRNKGLLFISLAAVHPLVWFYLNEARPYLMQYSIACLLIYVLCAFERSDNIKASQLWLFVLGISLMAGANLLGVGWSGTAVLIAIFIFLKKRQRPALLPILFGLLCLTGLAAYYAWTLSLGARGAGQSVRLAANIVYMIYELSGFSGLGPGRFDIRLQGIHSFKAFAVPMIAFFGAWLAILAYLARASRDVVRQPPLLIGAAFALPPAIFILILGALIQFSALARHAIAVLPFVLMIATTGIAYLLQNRNALSRIVAVFFIALSILSSLSIRFASRHAKDDYRAAAAAARQLLEANETVWWCASWEAGTFYRLPIEGKNPASAHAASWVRNPDESAIPNLPRPTAVILSKPDIYDAYGAVAKMLADQHFTKIETLQAFSIWKRNTREDVN